MPEPFRAQAPGSWEDTTFLGEGIMLKGVGRPYMQAQWPGVGGTWALLWTGGSALFILGSRDRKRTQTWIKPVLSLRCSPLTTVP